jgi:hypothetical protein
MRQVALILALTVPLSGCGWLSNSFAFVGEAFGFGAGGEGLPFRATAAAGNDPRDLVVSVPAGPTVALDDLRESARFPVTRYCIANFGTSQADWALDAATGDWAVTRTENGALLQARCMGRA